MSKSFNNKIPTAIDLFSGCGGLSEGLKRAGFSILSAIELDSKTCDTYALNHPDVHLVRSDIRAVSPESLMSEIGVEVGEITLLAGCPPCQGFSRLRKRNRKRASADARNSLIDDFLRFVIAIKPENVMMENVPGLKDHYRFKGFVRSLAALSYKVRVEILDVADYGVPQRRKRLVLLASRTSLPKMARPKDTRQTVRMTIAALPEPKASRDHLHRIPENRSERVKAMIRMIPKNGGSRSELPSELRLKCHEFTSGFRDVYGRMAWDDVAPTITGGCHNPSKGRFLHPAKDRNITLREAAMLQGFPKSYKFNPAHGKEAIALMIGNALPPPFIEAHAKALLSRL